MRKRITLIAVLLTALRAPVAAEGPARGLALPAPSGALNAPAWTIYLGQTPPPGQSVPVERGAPAGRAPAGDGEPILTLEDALAIALADNRGVRTATLEVGRAGDRIGAAKTRRFPALKVGVGADYPLVPIDLNF